MALINGIRLYYEDKGSGRPLVFIHHLAGSLRSWKYVIPYFTERYRVLTYDLRGHGRSEVAPWKYTIQEHKEDLKELLNLLNLDKPILIGHSLGSLVAIDYALEEKNVTGVVLIGALVKAPPREAYERYVSISMNFGMRALAEYRRKNGDFTKYLTEDPKIWSEFLSIYQENTPIGFKYTVEGLLEAPDYTERLRELEQPVLVIYGTEDRFSSNLETFKNNIKNLKYYLLESYGHFLNLESPELLSKIIIDFLVSLQV